jgi:hypothetical protein
MSIYSSPMCWQAGRFVVDFAHTHAHLWHFVLRVALELGAGTPGYVRHNGKILQDLFEWLPQSNSILYRIIGLIPVLYAKQFASEVDHRAMIIDVF